MTIEVLVGSVSGDSGYYVVTDRPRVALEFLQKQDHEGSSVGIKIDGDAEDAYSILELLTKQ